jgi:mannose-6-phosphate isomerase-like protein (cupin superfamily)
MVAPAVRREAPGMISTNNRQPILSSRASAPFTELLGGAIGVRIRGEDTGGELALVEQVVPAGYPGPPLHLHPDFDEHFYVIDGALAFRMGDEAFDGGPGAVVSIPRGTPHTFANRSSAPARALVIVTPAGHERFFTALAEAVRRAGGLPSPEEYGRLNAEHGVVVVAG